jgi:hypothetical protein
MIMEVITGPGFQGLAFRAWLSLEGGEGWFSGVKHVSNIMCLAVVSLTRLGKGFVTYCTLPF